MDFIIENIAWVIILATIAFFFFYKLISKNPNALTSKYKVWLKLSKDSDDLPEKIIDSLKKSGFRKVGYGPEENKYFAQTKISIWSWTEFIEIQVHKDENENKLIFTSKCALPLQVFDWGKNKRNANKFIKIFDAN